MTMAIISAIFHTRNVYVISLVLAGATMGFLYHNFHPASIFMGDCGSQFLGFMIAGISVYSFKSTTFITLAIPIILLFVPIFDTFSAIIRRMLKHQSISAPDKRHFHHVLMNTFGQTGATLTIYVITAVFGFTAYIYINDTAQGTLILILMVLVFEIFIEYTGMISNSYKPILNFLDKIASKHYHRTEEETKSDE
jgi:UDP-GlcNAc:undecaprenyl-phosphate GlcNAc-1-phosphate transferase